MDLRSNPLNRLNFSGGPGVLPERVLHDVQQAIIEVPGVGLSILGVSHRSEWFAAVVDEVERNIRALLDLPPDYHVLLLQGGATQQFSMVPMTMLRRSRHAAEYLHTGYWSGKAIPEARREGPLKVLWSGREHGFSRLPRESELSYEADAPYLHYVSNETVEGLQFHRVVGRDDVPRVCDLSSDFLSRPIQAERYALIYAHAQKNLGPAGVTIVVVRDDALRALDHGRPDLPGFLNYRDQIAARSIYNTPPVFSIYVVMLVSRWLREEIGGLSEMGRVNAEKAGLLYRVLDRSDGFYRGHAAVEDRSLMNVVFRLPDHERHERFLAEATAAGFSGLDGHRSIGGVRASIYNAMTIAAVEELAGFMDDFSQRNG